MGQEYRAGRGQMGVRILAQSRPSLVTHEIGTLPDMVVLILLYFWQY